MTAREILHDLLREWGKETDLDLRLDAEGALELTYAGRLPLLLEAAEAGGEAWLRLYCVLMPLPEAAELREPFLHNLLRLNLPGELPPEYALGLDNEETLLLRQTPLAGLEAARLQGLVLSFADLAADLNQELRALALELAASQAPEEVPVSPQNALRV
jgi:hypothetical protein